MPTLNDVLAGSLQQSVQVQQIIDALKGTPNKGVPVALVSLNDPNNYALTVQNDDPTNSRALSILKADGTPFLTCDINGVSLGSGTTPVNLPVGSVTSAMIVNGTVATIDLADGAVTSAKLGSPLTLPANSNPSVLSFSATGTSVALTSAVWGDIPNTTITPTATGTYLVTIECVTNLNANSNAAVDLALCSVPTGNGTTAVFSLIAPATYTSGSSGDGPALFAAGLVTLTSGTSYRLQGYVSGSSGNCIGRVFAVRVA